MTVLYVFAKGVVMNKKRLFCLSSSISEHDEAFSYSFQASCKLKIWYSSIPWANKGSLQIKYDSCTYKYVWGLYIKFLSNFFQCRIDLLHSDFEIKNKDISLSFDTKRSNFKTQRKNAIFWKLFLTEDTKIFIEFRIIFFGFNSYEKFCPLNKSLISPTLYLLLLFELNFLKIFAIV